MRLIAIAVLSIYSLIDGYRILTKQKDWDPNKYSRRHGVIVTDVERLKKISSLRRIFWGIIGLILVLIFVSANFINEKKWLLILLLIMLGGQIILTINTVKCMTFDRSEE